ncbi:ACT domain-containing protein [Eubacteriales bacterium OttesenSCG-928-N14]|nr:ACT domain-containing protein [Eubacteriales bacterium OttesenSCG-928-N14]
MKAIITVLGQDKPGIIAKVSTALAERNANILDISQTVLSNNTFAMTMLTDLSGITGSFGELKDALDEVAEQLQMEIRLQREEIFQSMYRV